MVTLALAEDTKTKKVKVNNTEIDEEALNAVGEITFPSIDEGNDLINCDNNVQMADNNDNVDHIYDWLADTVAQKTVPMFGHFGKIGLP
jgi:hypothetical protein